MKTYIGIVSILVLAFIWACGDKDDHDIVKNGENTMRVKKVSGHNETYGDFQFECAYSKDSRLDSAGIYNPAREKIGDIQTLYSGNTITFYVSKRVQGVDDETAAEMNPDSIPVISVYLYNAFSKQESEQSETRVYSYYGPEEHAPGTRYKVKYEVKNKVNCLLEYNKQGRVVIWRSPGNFDFDDDRMFKGEMSYEGERLTGITNYLHGNEGWQKIEPNIYHWQGDLLIKISGDVRGDNFETEFTYAGRYPEKITFRQNGGKRTVACQFNSEGYVTRIDEGNGNYMNIEYEAGNGNFSLLTPFLQQLTGMPFIQ